MSNEDVTQGTDEWKKMRLGLITGSRLNDVMQAKKGVGYTNYLSQLCCERLTGIIAEDGYKNSYMLRGNEDEAAARMCYEFVKGVEVEQVPFIIHPAMPYFGVSPDGLIGEDGMVEIKRKTAALHLAIARKGEVPSEYRKQMMGQLSVTGRQWNDFVSYCPEWPERGQIFIVRLHRDESEIAEIEAEVKAFNLEVERTMIEFNVIFK